MYDHDGWRGIEAIVYRYLAKPGHRDDVRTIVQDIQEHLKSSEVTDFLRQMGLLSVGYLFDAAWDKSKTVQFFRGGEERSLHYSTPYLWMDQSRSTRFGNLIHDLFLIVRDEQRERLRNYGYHFEEFYVCLPQVQSGKPSAERVHYCSIGELLLWLYAWRLLWYFEQLVSPGEPFESGRVHLGQSLSEPTRLTWGDQEVTTPGLVDAIAELNLADWAAEYRVLCLYYPKSSASTQWAGTIERHLQICFGSPHVLGQDLATLDASLQDAVAAWLAVVVPAEHRQSCKAARLWLETHAPAPLLPYYFWIGLDNWPKTYLVCPVWVSSLFPTKVRHGEEVKDTPIIGLALCGVAPLRAWDTSLTNAFVGSALGVRDTAKRDVIEFLTLLGQPAVDLNFYTEFRRVETERLTARHAYVLRGGMIHEIGQLAQMVLQWGMGTVAERQIVAECTAVKLASKALAEILKVGSYESGKRCREVVDGVKAALSWDDLNLQWQPAPDSMDCLLPGALEYVLIELGRNAYHNCARDSNGQRTVHIELKLTKSDDPRRIQEVTIRQLGIFNAPAMATDVDPDLLKPETGLNVVRYVVKEIIHGQFVIRQEGASVVAYVRHLGSNETS